MADTVEQDLAEAQAIISERDDRITELENSISASDHASEITALKSELDIALANTKTAVERAEAAEADLAGVHEFLESENAKVLVKEERANAVRELDVLPEARIEARSDEWATLSDEAFVAMVEDLKEIKVPADYKTTLPQTSALTAAADKNGEYNRSDDFALIANLRSKNANLASI